MKNQVPTISLIIPVHNGGEKFKQSLASVLQADPAPLEIIVVVDGGSDSSQYFAEASGAKILMTPVTSGPARARNLGARAAKGDLLFFIDADVTITSDAITQIAAAFQQNSGLAALIGSYDDAPAEANFLSQYRNLLHHYVHQTGNENASTFWGACGVVRREIFLELGGFDEKYCQPCVEDIELGYRFKRAGHRIRLLKTLQVKHLKRWEFAAMLQTDFFQRALPWTELILRERGMINDLNLKTSSRISAASVYGLLGASAISCRWPALAGVVALLIALLLAVNAPVYRFFWRKRGLRFALQTIPCHWLYYLYSGLAFVVGTMQFYFKKWGWLRLRNLKNPKA
jgi:glycosyltransferase involved in cell wall biosynthesis